jgi:hypothetical protein
MMYVCKSYYLVNWFVLDIEKHALILPKHFLFVLHKKNSHINIDLLKKCSYFSENSDKQILRTFLFSLLWACKSIISLNKCKYQWKLSRNLLIYYISLQQTVIGVVVSVLGTLINTSSAGTGSNSTIGIQSSGSV